MESKAAGGVVEADAIVISYETLFELLRREKNREDLQKLPASFYEGVLDYFIAQQRELTAMEHRQDLMASTEKSKQRMQLENIQRILKELYDRREKKIINMSINKSRIGSDIVDMSAMLEQEKPLFEDLVNNLNHYRNGILNKILSADAQIKKEPAQKEESAAVPVQKQEKPAPIVKKPQADAKVEKEPVATPENKEESAPEKTKMIRFTMPVPQFLSPDMEKLGPFEEDDMANVPEKVADVLIQKGRAEEIS